MKARTGKIARLPRHIREELNVRMADGASGKSLVAWLNAQPEVREVLERDFAGRPILEQNLSEWRRGGHREWCAQRELADELRLVEAAQLKRTDVEWRQWTVDAMKRIVAGSQTPEEALRRTLVLLHGHADEEIIAEDRRRFHEKAGMTPIPADATLYEGMASLTKSRARLAETPTAFPEGYQTESNPVKP